jgi:hypothetical protein
MTQQHPHPKRRPDLTGWIVRFVCGAIAGIFIAIFFIWDGMTAVGAVAWSLGLGTLFGFCAAQWGDRFWQFLGRWWGWF